MAEILAQRRNQYSQVTAPLACAALIASSLACGEWREDDAGDADTIVPDPALEADARAALDRHLERREFPGAVLAVHHPTRGDVVVSAGTTGPAAGDGAVDPDVPRGGRHVVTPSALARARMGRERWVLVLSSAEAPSRGSQGGGPSRARTRNAPPGRRQHAWMR